MKKTARAWENEVEPTWISDLTLTHCTLRRLVSAVIYLTRKRQWSGVTLFLRGCSWCSDRRIPLKFPYCLANRLRVDARKSRNQQEEHKLFALRSAVESFLISRDFHDRFVSFLSQFPFGRISDCSSIDSDYNCPASERASYDNYLSQRSIELCLQNKLGQ